MTVNSTRLAMKRKGLMMNSDEQCIHCCSWGAHCWEVLLCRESGVPRANMALRHLDTVNTAKQYTTKENGDKTYDQLIEIEPLG